MYFNQFETIAETSSINERKHLIRGGVQEIIKAHCLESSLKLKHVGGEVADVLVCLEI